MSSIAVMSADMRGISKASGFAMQRTGRKNWQRRQLPLRLNISNKTINFEEAVCLISGQAAFSTQRRTHEFIRNRKNNVSLREAAQAYGLEVNRHGKALCPFHNDRHPSLYVANDHYYCFTCGEHGDVIDFTARLFDLKPYDAAMKLVIDFHLDPDKPPSAAALNAKRIRTEAQKLKENERLCFSVLSDYYRCLEEWKAYYAPQTPDEPVHDLFVEACHKLSQIEYELNILTFGDSYERREIVQDWMTDGEIIALKERLEQLRKEETYGRIEYPNGYAA